MEEARIYRYNHANCKWYGQGLNEEYVRLAMESKLNLEPGTLSIGNDRLSLSEIQSITMSSPDIGSLFYKLRIPRNISRPVYLKLSEILEISGMNRDQVNSVISKELNVPRDLIDNMDLSTTIKNVLRSSNNKIIVRTHKIIKEPSDSQSNLGQGRKNIVKDVFSRVDEIREQISKLLSLDYWLIVESNNYEEELEKTKSSLSKAKHLLSKKRHELTNEEITKYSNNIQTLPKEIKELEDKVAQQNNRYYNTGYYVNTFDQYEESSYEEVLEKFDQLYHRLRNKVLRYNFDRIPYKEGSEISMIEALDSFCIVARQNNHYAK